MEYHNNIGDSSNLLTDEAEELEKMKENLKQAKDDAMQSYLDSRPLIDELEKKQAELANAKDRLAKANTAISEIQAQLGTTDMCIKSSKEEELMFHTIVNDKNQDLHKAQEEMEQLKIRIDQKRRRRLKLKQVLKIKRQTLQMLELTYQAVQLESEALTTSEAQAARHINHSEAVNIMVRLTHEEYELLKGEAKEQASLERRRISEFMEEKHAAEKNRELTFKRLQRLYPHRRSNNGHNMEKATGSRNTRNQTEGNVYTERGQTNYRSQASSRTQAKTQTGFNKGDPKQRLNNNIYSMSVSKTKSSFFVRIRMFFVRKLAKYFK